MRHGKFLKGEVFQTPDFVGLYFKFFGGITLLFVVLKLLHVIHWKLRWVLAPLWMPSILIVILIIVLAVKDRFSD